jgi:hypothetical protein
MVHSTYRLYSYSLQRDDADARVGRNLQMKPGMSYETQSTHVRVELGNTWR